MKKGASHVDWAISMGIFLVFVMLTLIFLRPGTEPIYKGDVLLGVAEDGLDINGTITLEKGFLMIDATNVQTDEYSIRIRNPTQKGLNPDWVNDRKHLGLVGNRLGTIPDEVLPYIFYDFYENGQDCDPCDACENPCDVLDIKVNLVGGQKNIFWFIYAEDERVEYPEPGAGDGPGDLVNYDYDNDGDKPDPYEGIYIRYEEDDNGLYSCQGHGDIPPCLLDCESVSLDLDKCNFTYKFGVIERQTGFFPNKIGDIDGLTDDPDRNYPDDPDDYDELKKYWGIPEDKNFQIIIEQTV